MSSPFLSHRAPLLWLLGPMMTGLAAARIWAPPAVGVWPFLAAAATTAVLGVWAATGDRVRLCLAALVVSSGCSGYALLHLRHPQLHRTENRPPREITVTLEVDTLFGAAPGSRSVTGLGRITATGAHEGEMVGQLVYFSAIRRISAVARPAAGYEVRGVLEPLPRDAPAGFDGYLANLGVRHRLGRAHLVRETAAPGRLDRLIGALRDRFERILNHGLERHPGAASLYLAMMLGEKAVLSPEQEAAFMNSGTFHVFSVSGLHVGVIALALRHLTRVVRLPVRAGALITLVVLWLYVQVTGAGTPSVRAYIMVAFLLASEAIRLPGNAFSALVASALCTLLLEPLQLFSTGFQMSYSVVAALILLGSPLAERWLQHWHPFVLRPRPEWRWWHDATDWLGRKVITAAAGCWAAFLASLPSSIGYFGVLSPGSLPANLVILPLCSLAIVSGFLSLLCGSLGLLPWSALFNAAAALLILAAEWLLREGTELPGVFFPAAFRAVWLAPAAMAALTAVLIAGVAGRWAPRYGGFWPPVVLLVLLLAFGVQFGE